MPRAAYRGHHGAVTSAQVADPTRVQRLSRRPDIGLLGGVAAGIGRHLGVSPRTVRLVFIALAVSGGLGVALYGAYWVVLPSEGRGRPRWPSWLEYILAAAAVIAAVASVVATSWTGLFGPTLLACIGGALLWRQAGGSDRVRWQRLSTSSLQAPRSGWLGRLRILFGTGLVIGAAALVLQRADVTTVRDGVVFVAVTVAGVALLTGPWWMRLVTQLSAERAERIRSQERADIAAHLHDSVLQTLALIQRNADSPREVARLARGQERALRDLLYRDRAASGRLAEQLRGAAAEVEDSYAVAVEIVIVGDAEMSESMAAASAAAREALVNAAKHSGASTVSLYAEVEPSVVSVFIRDRGIGFDLDGMAPDRQGVRGSIVGRVERNGGTVQIRTAPGAGTEVAIRMPR